MTGPSRSPRGKNRPRRPAPAAFALRARLTAAGLLAVSILAAGCGGDAEKQAYLDDLAEHRAQRLERLRAEDGWLTIAGLFWLEPGENRFGTAADNAVVLPEGTAPAHGGVFVLADGAVTVRAEAGSGLALDGVEVTERRLISDAEGPPDRLTMDRLKLWVIQRGDKFAIRMRDPQSALRKNFAWLDFYAPDPEYRIEATFLRYPEPRRVPMENMAGTVDSVIVPGEAVFTLDGTECALLPVVDDPADSSFFFVFSDGTSGDETYAAGRFLAATLEPGDRVVLDFNRAYNPPCAFNPYTTCPLPLPENRLAVKVRAGEKAYDGGDH